MSEGAHGDLFPPRFYQQSTPVNATEANEPLEDLHANTLILDGKVAEHLANHPGGSGGGGPVSSTGTISRFVDIFLNTASGTPPISGVIGTDIDALVRQHAITVTELNIAAKENTGVLRGRAQSETAAVNFKNALIDVGFGEVSLPLSNIAAQPDGTVAFSLTFKPFLTE